MPPEKKCRHCRHLNGARGFKPMGIPFDLLKQNFLQLDELEAMRLVDEEGKSQIEAGEAMGISRGTVQRLLLSGRKKVIDVLVNNKILMIEEKENE